MTSKTISQASDTGADVVARHGADIVTIPRLYANPGLTNRVLRAGDVFRLTVCEDSAMGERLNADRAEHLSHLDGHQPGYQWGEDDDPDDDHLHLRFTYLGEYTYLNSTLDEQLEVVLVRFRRVIEKAAA